MLKKRKHSDLEEGSDEFSSAEDVDDDICGLDDYLSTDDSDFRVKHFCMRFTDKRNYKL